MGLLDFYRQIIRDEAKKNQDPGVEVYRFAMPWAEREHYFIVIGRFIADQYFVPPMPGKYGTGQGHLVGARWNTCPPAIDREHGGRYERLAGEDKQAAIRQYYIDTDADADADADDDSNTLGRV